MPTMDENNAQQQAFNQKLETLEHHLSGVRRKMETLMAENQRLREVVRLAESELRKRREQVQQMELTMQDIQHRKNEASARVEHAMEKLDQLIATNDQGES